ncbi:hypothetical protein F4703DRAFT_1799299 [Phycomyces blakesleeanus]
MIFLLFSITTDTRVLLPSDASPSQCPSGLAKAISPKLLSTIKHGYEHDEPPSHEHIANQELSFHTSVIDMTILASPMYSLGLQINPFASGSILSTMIGEVYGSKQYKKKSLRLDKINSNTTKPCKNWHIHKLNNDILQQNVILSCRFSACGKNPYTENANTSYYPAVLTFSYVRKLVLPPMILHIRKPHLFSSVTKISGTERYLEMLDDLRSPRKAEEEKEGILYSTVCYGYSNFKEQDYIGGFGYKGYQEQDFPKNQNRTEDGYSKRWQTAIVDSYFQPKDMSIIPDFEQIHKITESKKTSAILEQQLLLDLSPDYETYFTENESSSSENENGISSDNILYTDNILASN